MSFKNKTIQKSISALLIILLIAPAILLAIPKKTLAQAEQSVSTCAQIIAKVKAKKAIKNVTGTGVQAVPVTNKQVESSTSSTSENTDAVKEYKLTECINAALKELLKLAARRLLAKMTESTVNWINTGFHGAPLFVENPDSFFKDIAKSEIRELVSMVGYNSTSFPFGKNAALGSISSYKSTFAQNAQYSLSKVTSDANYIQQFQNDFSVGGWDGFLLQTQFPQNNPLGFNMLYSEELAKKLAGSEPQSKANIIRDTLQQGQGFLSPETCPSNPKYNNLKNQFQKPVFKSKLTPPPYYGISCDEIPDTSGNNIEQCMADNAAFDEALKAEKAAWDDLYSCPGGLERTTPGSVVASQIMKAINSPFSQTELGAAMGNSLSAIFDALLNKLLSSGLNALTNKINGIGSGGSSGDDFSYDGQTLGTSGSSTNGGAGFTWNSPDQVVTLGGVKTDVQNTIKNITKELSIINNTSTTTPGIFQIFEKIWPKTAELDACLPGPDFGWQDRVENEIQNAGGSTTSAVAFQEAVTTKMKAELPSSYTFLTAVNSVTNTNEQNAILLERERALTEALIKLESINSEVGDISVEPEPGTVNESKLIQAKQRYDSIVLDISTNETLADAQNKLADAKDKLNSLSTLLNKCTTERTTKGWSNPGGAFSVFKDDVISVDPGQDGNYYYVNPNSEQYIFCNSLDNVGVSCGAIYNSTIADYKG